MILNEAQLKSVLRNAYIGDECLDYCSDLQKYIMLITASCGRGKTYYTLSLDENGMLAEINRIRRKNNLFVKDLEDIKPYEVLFLTSRKIVRIQQIENNPNCVEAKEYDFDGSENWEDADRVNKILVSTAHRFGEWVREGKVKRMPKVIVLDEIHSLFAETIFADSLYYTLEYIKENYNDLIKIGLSATPQFLFNYVKDETFRFYTIDIDLGSKYKAQNIYCYKNGQATTILKQIKPKISSTHKVLYYTQSARECYRLSKEYGNRSAFLVSDYNETEIDGRYLVDIMNERLIDELTVKQYINKYEKFPEDIDIIFINSACREGMNIKDKAVKTVICEAVDMITIEQVLGRIRGDLENFMVVCNFNNSKRINENLKELEEFIKKLENAENKDAVMARRYGEQKQNKFLSKFVYEVGEEKYKLNTYAKAYLQYINESYIQIKNYETKSKGEYTYKIGDRDLLTYDEYLNQLCRYAEDGRITIEMVWNAVVEKNHENALEAFQKIESDWLDKPLGTEEKKVLVAELACVRSKGQKASWNTLQKVLETQYNITESRKNNKRYVIISKK